jgi:hypothetical protein
MMQFTALEDFFSPETQSHYCKGLSYTVRPFVDHPAWDEKTRAQVKARCEALARLAPQWLAEGKIRLGGPEGGQMRGG